MKTLTVCCSILLFSVLARADNCSGKWVIETAGRGGRIQRTVLTLNQTGETLTGTMARPGNQSMAAPVDTEIHDGKVVGDTVTFYLWQGSDRPWKQQFRGKISGDEIVFVVTDDRPQPPANTTGQSAAAANRPTTTTETAKRSQ